MKTLRTTAAIAALLAGMGAAQAVDPVAAHKAEMKSGTVDPHVIAAGKTVYETYCVACHQSDGKGMNGAFPPLAGPCPTFPTSRTRKWPMY